MLCQLSHKNFSEMVNKYDIVVVDFWAKWCNPCMAFKKVIEKLNDAYPEVLFGQVDIDTEKELAQDFNITTLPSILLLRRSIVVYAETGALTASALKELIEKAKALPDQKLKAASESN